MPDLDNSVAATPQDVTIAVTYQDKITCMQHLLESAAEGMEIQTAKVRILTEQCNNFQAVINGLRSEIIERDRRIEGYQIIAAKYDDPQKQAQAVVDIKNAKRRAKRAAASAPVSKK